MVDFEGLTSELFSSVFPIPKNVSCAKVPSHDSTLSHEVQKLKIRYKCSVCHQLFTLIDFGNTLSKNCLYIFTT